MTNRSTSAKVARSGELRRLVGTLGDWAVGPGPLFRQLARAVAGAIEGGALAEGLRLPSERGLASALFVSRGTTVAAYDQLVADGLVERRHGSGTFVAGPAALGLPDGREGSALVHRLVERSSVRSTVVDLSISVLHDAGGLPAVTLSSRDLRAMVPETGYSPWGSPGLRALIADHVTAWGLPTVPGQIVITSGAQQGISAAAACWLRPGDTVVVEDPCYPGAIAAFAQARTPPRRCPRGRRRRAPRRAERGRGRPARPRLPATDGAEPHRVGAAPRPAPGRGRARPPVPRPARGGSGAGRPELVTVSGAGGGAVPRCVGGRRRFVEQGSVGWAPARVRAGARAAGPALRPGEGHQRSRHVGRQPAAGRASVVGLARPVADPVPRGPSPLRRARRSP